MASSSRWVLVPPLCFLLMCKWRLPYDPNILAHSVNGHIKFFSIWSLVLLSALRFLVSYEVFYSYSAELCVVLFYSMVEMLLTYRHFNSFSPTTLSTEVYYVILYKLSCFGYLGCIFIWSFSFSFYIRLMNFSGLASINGISVEL